MLVNRIYSGVAKHTPISVINAYYKQKNAWQPDAWRDFPVYFIHVPKTAGTSICAALQMPDSGHLLFHEMRRKTAREISHKRCFIVVRDPVDRLLSTYNYATEAWRSGRRNLVNFAGQFDCAESFLQEIIRRQTLRAHYFLRPSSDFYDSAIYFGAKVDVIKFEEVNVALPAYLLSMGLGDCRLPRKKVSKVGNDGSDQISSETSANLMEIYQKDKNLRDQSWAV